MKVDTLIRAQETLPPFAEYDLTLKPCLKAAAASKRDSGAERPDPLSWCSSQVEGEGGGGGGVVGVAAVVTTVGFSLIVSETSAVFQLP